MNQSSGGGGSGAGGSKKRKGAHDDRTPDGIALRASTGEIVDALKSLNCTREIASSALDRTGRDAGKAIDLILQEAGAATVAAEMCVPEAEAAFSLRATTEDIVTLTGTSPREAHEALEIMRHDSDVEAEQIRGALRIIATPGILRKFRELEVQRERAWIEHLGPCSKQLMADPVIAADGYVYERAWIERWFSGGNETSPLTREVLTDLTLRSNRSLGATIEHAVRERADRGFDRDFTEEMFTNYRERRRVVLERLSTEGGGSSGGGGGGGGGGGDPVREAEPMTEFVQLPLKF